MEITLKSFSSFDRWSHPDIAKKISGILGTTNPEQYYTGTLYKDQIESDLGEFDVPNFWSGNISIKSVYNAWMWTNDKKYFELKKLYNRIYDDIYRRRLEPKKDQCNLYKINNYVVIIWSNKGHQFVGLRSYKDDKGKIAGRILTVNNFINLFNGLKVDFYSLKYNPNSAGINLNQDRIFGRYDELTFEPKKINYRKSPFPIPIKEYDFNVPNDIKDSIAMSKGAGFDNYAIIGKCVKFSDLDTGISVKKINENTNRYSLALTRPYLAFYNEKGKIAIYILTQEMNIFGTFKVKGVFRHLGKLPDIKSSSMNYYPLKRIK